MESISKDTKGVTLIEIIVALVILGALGVVGTMALAKMAESYQWSKDNAHLTQKAQVALTRMAMELNYATKIKEVTNNSIKYDAQYPDGTEFKNNLIEIQGNQLFLRPTNTEQYVLANNVTAFTLSEPNNYLIDIELHLEGVNGVEQVFTTSIAHR